MVSACLFLIGFSLASHWRVFLIGRIVLVEPVNHGSYQKISSSEIPRQSSRGVDVLDIGSNHGGSASFMDEAFNQVLQDSHKRNIDVKPSLPNLIDSLHKKCYFTHWNVLGEDARAGTEERMFLIECDVVEKC